MTLPVDPLDDAAHARRPRWQRPGWLLVGLAAAVGLALWGAPRMRGVLRPATAAADSTDTARVAGVPLPPPGDTAARPPAGARVRVQVLNATRVRGLARRATRYLRDRGWDVVEVGTQAEQLDTTLVLDRSGHPEWARRAAHAMGGARTAARPDTSRYLDLTVLVGRTWRPPAEPLDP